MTKLRTTLTAALAVLMLVGAATISTPADARWGGGGWGRGGGGWGHGGGGWGRAGWGGGWGRGGGYGGWGYNGWGYGAGLLGAAALGAAAAYPYDSAYGYPYYGNGYGYAGNGYGYAGYSTPTYVYRRTCGC
jgi:hypothetical protein